MPFVRIPFDEFVEFFLNDDKTKVEKYKNKMEDDIIMIEYEYLDDDYMVSMRWREEDGKWKRMRYNGSSSFAMWWCQFDEEE
jgi:hypothetical protein